MAAAPRCRSLDHHQRVARRRPAAALPCLRAHSVQPDQGHGGHERRPHAAPPPRPVPARGHEAHHRPADRRLDARLSVRGAGAAVRRAGVRRQREADGVALRRDSGPAHAHVNPHQRLLHQLVASAADARNEPRERPPAVLAAQHPVARHVGPGVSCRGAGAGPRSDGRKWGRW